MQINCSTHDFLSIDDLTEFQGELKHRDTKDIDKIIKSITKHGFCFPFFVWSHDGINHVFDGHGRLAALKDMQSKGELIPQLPVVYINAKNEADAKELLLKLNSHYGQMTQESVLNFLDGVDIDFDDIALPDTTLEFLQDDEQDDEQDDDTPAIDDESEPNSKEGEIYQLGDHLLMCGDSTDDKNISLLMGSLKADCVFTDPPYHMFLDADYSSMKNNLKMSKDKGLKGGKKYNKVIGDGDDFKPELITSIFKNFDYCKEVFLWGADYYSELLTNKNEGSWVVWDKRANGDNNTKKDESSDKMFGSCFELCWSKTKHKRDIARVKWCGVFGTEQEFDHKRHHPTQKPTKLIQWFLHKYTKENDVVVDVFGGSGSTLLGCAMSKRICRTIELDPRYCDVIRKRYTQFAKDNNLPLTSGCLD